MFMQITACHLQLMIIVGKFFFPGYHIFQGRWKQVGWVGKQRIDKLFFTTNSATLISLIDVEVGINLEGGIFWKKLVHNSNKREVEGGKNLRNQ